MDELKKKYGLFTAICVIVGTVIGSGVFFKAKDALMASGGNALCGVLAWLIGGLIMVTLAATFAVMATKYEKVNGIVDYAEVGCGKSYSFFIGWFLSLIYYPAMTAVLAWVTARYTLVAVLGHDEMLASPECFVLAGVYLIVAYFINALAPRLAGKIQVSTTIIKLIPIAFIAIVGSVIGLINGTLITNFDASATVATAAAADGGTGVFAAICATAFAYEGWIIATTLNAEIKNSKRNLPLALLIGTLIIVAVYVLYYIGILGLENASTLMENGTSVAFLYFGKAGATLINTLIIFSCFGTLNGLMLGCSRGMYSLSARGEGISPKIFGEVDRHTNMPHNSAALALLICQIWFLYFAASQIFGWFGEYGFDSSELPIITIYPLYAPILISFMIKERGLHPFKRFVLPFLSLVGCGIMVAASIARHGMGNVWYLIVFALIMGAGALTLYFNKKKENALNKEL